MKLASTRLSVVVLLLLLAAQTITAMKTKSATCDEFAHHLANGYSYLLTHDFRMNPASPPLSRMLPAAPLLFFDAKLPLNHPSWATIDSPEFAKQFFYHANHGVADKFIFWSRVPIVLVSVLFGLVLFTWSRSLFGDAGGLAALVLYVFSPNILAHSGLATADLMVAFFFFSSLVSFWAYLRNPRPKNLFLTGFLVGLTFLSKFSAVLLLPILLLIALFSKKTEAIRPKKTLLFLATCFITVWAGYFFEVKPLLQHTPDPAKKEAFIQKIGGEGLVTFAKTVPIPLATFSSAVVSMAFTRANGCDAFLLGQWSTNGWWYYYFVAFFLKETIPFIILMAGSFFFLRSLRLDRVTMAVLLVPVVFFFIVTLRDKAQAGIRYFLPIFPCLFVLAGGFAAHLWQKRSKALKVLVVALLSWHVVESLSIYPDYLAYFNEFAGGPSNGYKYLRDSNIDWAQDLKGVGVLTQKEKYPEVVVISMGIQSPSDYNIPYRWPEAEEFKKPRDTVYAVGAHRIDSVTWAAGLKPTAVVGHSFFIYDMRTKGPDK